MSLSFLLTSFLWTGLLALIAEGLTRRQVTPYFAQSIWRFTALFMVVPWAGLVFGPLMPTQYLPLPEFPDLIPFSLADDTPAILKAASHEETVKSINPSHLLLSVLMLGWGVQCLASLAPNGPAIYASRRIRKLPIWQQTDHPLSAGLSARSSTSPKASPIKPTSPILSRMNAPILHAET